MNQFGKSLATIILSLKPPIFQYFSVTNLHRLWNVLKKLVKKAFKQQNLGGGQLGQERLQKIGNTFKRLEKVWDKTVFSSWIPGKFLGMMWRKLPKDSRPWKRQMSYGLKNLFTPMLFRNTVSLPREVVK